MDGLELYLNDQFIELSEQTRIGLTTVANDIASIQDKRANFTNQFKLPATGTNIAALGFPATLNSTSYIPYTKVAARLLQDGIEIVSNGYAIIDSSDDTINVTIYSGNADFFELIKDKKLTDLDFSEYDHDWNLANMQPNILYGIYESGFIYGLVDYGKLGGGKYELKYQLPCIRVKRIIEKIFAAAGFTLKGGIYEDADSILHTMVLPYSRNEIQIDQSQFANFLFDVKRNVDFTVSAPVLLHKTTFIFDNEISDPSNLFSGGIYTCPNNMAYKFTASIDFDITVTGTGLTETQIKVEIANAVTGYIYNSENYSTNSHSVSGGNVTVTTSSILLNTGDKVTVNVWIGKLGTLATSVTLKTTSEFYNYLDQANLVYGQRLVISQLLPDMSQTDFIKQVLQLTCGIIQTDGSENTVYMEFLKKLYDNKPIAKEWRSDKITRGKDAIRFHSNYAKNNLLLFKKDEFNLINPEIGNGNFIVNDDTLPAEKTVVQLLFAGSDQGESRSIGAVSVSPPLVDKIDDTTFMFTLKTQPRILLYKRETLSNTVHYLGDGTVDGGTTSFDSDQAYSCWFIDTVNQRDYKLGFNNNLVELFYSTLINMLDNYKEVTADVYIDATDLNGYFDHLIPIYLSKYQEYFYINSISNFQKGKLTKVNLTRL